MREVAEGLVYVVLFVLGMWLVSHAVVQALDRPEPELSVEELDRRRKVLESYGYVIP